jgi:hypothetical protein
MSKEKLKNVLIVSLDYLLEEKYENAIKVIDDYLTSVQQ